MEDFFDEIITDEGSGNHISLYANFDEPDARLIDLSVSPNDFIHQVRMRQAAERRRYL